MRQNSKTQDGKQPPLKAASGEGPIAFGMYKHTRGHRHLAFINTFPFLSAALHSMRCNVSSGAPALGWRCAPRTYALPWAWATSSAPSLPLFPAWALPAFYECIYLQTVPRLEKALCTTEGDSLQLVASALAVCFSERSEVWRLFRGCRHMHSFLMRCLGILFGGRLAEIKYAEAPLIYAIWCKLHWSAGAYLPLRAGIKSWGLPVIISKPQHECIWLFLIPLLISGHGAGRMDAEIILFFFNGEKNVTSKPISPCLGSS